MEVRRHRTGHARAGTHARTHIKHFLRLTASKDRARSAELLRHSILAGRYGTRADYSAARPRGRAASVPNLNVQFPEFSMRQRARRSRGRCVQTTAYLRIEKPSRFCTPVLHGSKYSERHDVVEAGVQHDEHHVLSRWMNTRQRRFSERARTPHSHTARNSRGNCC